MTDAEFDFLRGFLKSRSGLALAPEKRYLVESRLAPVCRSIVLRRWPTSSRGSRPLPDPALARAVVEAMTTNETFFFRDRVPFDLFRDVLLPRCLAAQAATRRLRIWCAAASTGQEPYSLAMILREAAPRLLGWTVEIVATDISGEVLERARSGLYSQFEVQRGLPIALLLKHFTQTGDNWQLSPAIRAMVEFRQLNLLKSFAELGTFDIVLCRNVLIYFDAADEGGRAAPPRPRPQPGGHGRARRRRDRDRAVGRARAAPGASRALCGGAGERAPRCRCGSRPGR